MPNFMAWYCGQPVHGLGMNCGWIEASPQYNWADNFGVFKSRWFSTQLSNFCTHFLHTQNLIFTSVLNKFYASSTGLTINTTTYI